MTLFIISLFLISLLTPCILIFFILAVFLVVPSSFLHLSSHTIPPLTLKCLHIFPRIYKMNASQHPCSQTTTTTTTQLPPHLVQIIMIFPEMKVAIKSLEWKTLEILATATLFSNASTIQNFFVNSSWHIHHLKIHPIILNSLILL